MREPAIPSTPNDMDRCCKCGKEPRVWLDGTPYCAACYNMWAEDAAGLPHAGEPRAAIVVIDRDGRAVEFAVERMVHAVGIGYTATEVVPDGDPRAELGYVGLQVQVLGPLDGDQAEAVDALWRKAQQAASKRSLDMRLVPDYECWSGCVRRGNTVMTACESGLARVEWDEETGGTCLVVDGYKFTGDEFVEMLSCVQGFNLSWVVTDACDPFPKVDEESLG